MTPLISLSSPHHLPTSVPMLFRPGDPKLHHRLKTVGIFHEPKYWHYKYQETLEIHMKEKHPENDSTCVYCVTGQQHPKLARGEAYTCGYKPYRCDICNYSTTTKGNLSIHMQSDKHINNVQVRVLWIILRVFFSLRTSRLAQYS